MVSEKFNVSYPLKFWKIESSVLLPVDLIESLSLQSFSNTVCLSLIAGRYGGDCISIPISDITQKYFVSSPNHPFLHSK